MKKLKNFFWVLLIYFSTFVQVFADPAEETTVNTAEDGFALIPTGDIKGCDFKTGDMSFECIPNYIQYLIEIIVGIAGTIAVIFVMVGGFKYVFSGISEDKEAGKETIRNALLGLVITGLAWVIVTWIVSLVTM